MGRGELQYPGTMGWRCQVEIITAIDAGSSDDGLESPLFGQIYKEWVVFSSDIWLDLAQLHTTLVFVRSSLLLIPS